MEGDMVDLTHSSPVSDGSTAAFTPPPNSNLSPATLAALSESSQLSAQLLTRFSSLTSTPASTTLPNLVPTLRTISCLLTTAKGQMDALLKQAQVHQASVSSSSPPPSSSSSSAYAASSSSSPFVGDDMMSDDAASEALIRQIAAEEEALKQRRAEAAEREFQELIKRERTCARCGVMQQNERELIQIADGGNSQPACEHKVCHPCLRDALLNTLQKHSSASASASSPPSPTFSPSRVSSDLICPVPACRTPLQQWQMKLVLPPADFDRVLEYTVNSLVRQGSIAAAGVGDGENEDGVLGSEVTARFVTCPNVDCRNTFEAVEGGAGVGNGVGGSTALGLDGQPMSAIAQHHRARNRFRCVCGTVFCGGCSTTPYHDGFTCGEYANYKNAPKCRFCSTPLTAANTAQPGSSRHKHSSSSSSSSIGGQAVALVSGFLGGLLGAPSSSSSSSSAASSSSSSLSVPTASSSSSDSIRRTPLADVCNSPDCLSRRDIACDRYLPCGHACGGVRGEKECLPCLKADCPSHVSSGLEEDDDSYCTICYTEGLGQAPTIRLGCGHYYHFECITSKLSRGWPGARITFGFLNCPLCKQEMAHPALTQLMAPLIALKLDIRKRATARLTFEGLDKDEAFTSPTGRYYGRKEDYAMDRFAYYKCFKCQVPYFGGRRQCEEVAMANEGNFNEQHLVCGGCTAGSDVKNCAKHGKEYIEYKCRFCCNVATFYCWGSTHFCRDCHKRQETGDYLTRKARDQLPQCPGVDKCPLGVQHPQNGTEFALGCGICRPRSIQ